MKDRLIPLLRAANHYQQVLSGLEVRMGSGELSRDEARDILRHQLPQFEHLAKQCADFVETNLSAAVLCAKFAGVAGQLFETELPRLKIIEWRENSVRAAEKALASKRLTDEFAADLRNDLMAHLGYLGYAHLMNQNLVRGRECCEQAMELGEKIGSQLGMATARGHLAMIAMTEGKLDEAKELLERAVEEFRELKMDGGVAATLTTLASLASQQQDYDAAVGHYTEVINLHQNRPEPVGLATAFANRCGDFISLRRYEEAREDLVKAKDLAQRCGVAGLRGLILANEARMLLTDDDVEKRQSAVGLYEQARKEFSQTGDRLQERRILAILVQIYEGSLKQDLSPEQRRYALLRLGEIHGVFSDFDKQRECML